MSRTHFNGTPRKRSNARTPPVLASLIWKEKPAKQAGAEGGDRWRGPLASDLSHPMLREVLRNLAQVPIKGLDRRPEVGVAPRSPNVHRLHDLRCRDGHPRGGLRPHKDDP
jgi:hypothetical protein